MKKVLLFAALCAGAVFGWGLSRATEGILHESDPRGELPPCFEVGAPFHHRFRPNCTGSMKTPREPARVSINEDGLRDLARLQVLKNADRVLVMGDSNVEGWWSSQDQALSALLSERFPGTYFINGGLRSTGPVMQSEKLRDLVRIYRPRGVIWLVNDTDGLDDRFACAITENAGAKPLRFTAPEFELGGLQAAAAALLGNTAASNRLRRRFYQEKWLSLAHGENAGRCDPCRGANAFRAELGGLPSLVFYLHTRDATGQYGNGAAHRQELQACLGKAGFTVRAAGLAGMSPEEMDRYLWEGDFHLNPEGVAMLAGQIAPAVEAWLKEGGKKNAGRPR